MDYLQFNHTLDMGKPPEDFNDLLKSLWWERKGEWETAHKLVKDKESKDAFWLHGYLHRKEEDYGNAQYWYSKAEKDIPAINIIEEFREITKAFLLKYT